MHRGRTCARPGSTSASISTAGCSPPPSCSAARRSCSRCGSAAWHAPRCHNPGHERPRLHPGGRRRADHRRRRLPLPRARRIRRPDRERRSRRPAARGRGAARPRGARPDAPGHGRAGGDAAAAGVRRGAARVGDPAHREGRARGPDRGAPARRRRLRRQALLTGRAGRAGRRGAAPGREPAGARGVDRPRRPGGGPERPARLRARRGGAADRARVRPAPALHAPPRPGVLARPADGRGLAVQLLQRHLDRDRAHAAAAGEDRVGPLAATLAADRVGRRLPVPAMRKEATAFLLTVIAAVVGGLVMGSVYGSRDRVITAIYLLVYGTAVVAAVAGLRRRRRTSPLARQLAGGVALSIGLSTVGVVVIALAMFLSPHDALVMVVLLAFSGGLAA